MILGHRLAAKTLSVLLIITILTSCVERSPLLQPAEQDRPLLLRKSASLKRFYLSTEVTSSNAPLSVGSFPLPSKRTNEVIGDVNLTDVGTGRIAFSSPVGCAEKSRDLPETIDLVPSGLQYSRPEIPVDGKLGELWIKLKNKMSEVRAKASIHEKGGKKILWSKLSSAEVAQMLGEDGRKVGSLGNNRYEVTSQIAQSQSSDGISIRMTFNASACRVERVDVYRGTRKSAEFIPQGYENGKGTVYSKIHGGSEGEPRNLLIRQQMSR